ncbi:ion channel [Devosia sp. CAU 1758]
MSIVLATLIGFAAMAASVLLHYQSMLVGRTILQGSGLSRRTGVFVGMASVTVAQIIGVFIYAVIYYLMNLQPFFGSLEGELQGGFLDPLYFSLMSYTTLGVGDIYPMGALRIISGIEALNGFALIGWTASFAYTLMQQGWSD